MKGQSENKDIKKKFEDFTFPVNDANWDAISARLPQGSPSGILGAKFSNYTAAPSPKVWDNIAAAIQPFKRRPAAWWWYAAVASLLLFASLGYWRYESANNTSELPPQKVTNVSEEPKDQLTAKEQTASDQDSSQSSSAATSTLTERATATSEATRDVGKQQLRYAAAAHTETNVIAVTTTAERPSAFANVDESVHSQASGMKGEEQFEMRATKGRGEKGFMAKSTVRPPQTMDYSVTPGFISFKEIPALAQIDPEKQNRRSSDFYDGTEAASSHNFSLWAGSLVAIGASGNASEMNAPTFSAPESGLASSVSSVFAQNFSPPIYYGINGEFKFCKRLAAAAGVGFLRMHSTSTEYMSTGERVVSDIHNTYISIPIYLKFNFIDKPKFAAYSSVGHGFDILAGHSKSTENPSNLQSASVPDPYFEDPGNQANLYGGLGMHFKFTRQFGIFAEGSLMHYYSMSNSNFYSQQKFWPGLRFGLLFTFE